MKSVIFANTRTGSYEDPTGYQNSTLRYVPPVDFPEYLASTLGRAKIMRVWITLDEYYDYKTGEKYPDYDIGCARCPVKEMYYHYDWGRTVPAPSGTRFRDYLRSHSEKADVLLLGVRRLEREVSDGIISYEKYTEIFSDAVDYCKSIAPNIKYIECCNEPELSSFGALNSEEYYRIYMCAYRAVKELNRTRGYDIPLLIGGDGVPSPLVRIDLWEGFLRLLSETKTEDKPIDFYSYHHYDIGARSNLLRMGFARESEEMGIVDRYRLIVELHERLLEKYGLPKAELFMDEWGKAAATNNKYDNLLNATGNILTMNAQVQGKLGDFKTFPWCTFHNPDLQISYTQYTLREDGSYVATPNALALIMLHRLRGDILRIHNTAFRGNDTRYRALAVRDGDVISVVVCNPRGVPEKCTIEIREAEAGDWRVEEYMCNSDLNNCVTGSGSGAPELELTSSYELMSGGCISIERELERDAFMLIRLRKA